MPLRDRWQHQIDDLPWDEPEKTGHYRKLVTIGIIALSCVLVILLLLTQCAGGVHSFHVESKESALAISDEQMDVIDHSSEKSIQNEKDVAKLLVVHIGGAVANPGVYSLPEGSRVVDAISAAGGFSEGSSCDSVNLARLLVDAEQIIVPSLDGAIDGGAPNPQSASMSSAEGVSAGKVNINTATIEQLVSLPGIGEVTAQKILADRENNGAFSSCEDLKRVSGIGDKKYEALAELICV